MKKNKWMLGAAAIVVMTLFVCGVWTAVHMQNKYAPVDRTEATDVSRSMVYVTGSGYKIDKGQKKFNKSIEKKKEAGKSDYESNQKNNGTGIGQNGGGYSGSIDMPGSSGGKTDNRGSGNIDNSKEDVPEKDLRPTISTNLYDGETVEGSYVSFYLISKDRNGRHITADNVSVTCNGTRITSTGDDGNKISYRADLQNGANEFSMAATDKYGLSRTITRTVKCDINGTKKKIGHVWMEVNARTVGLGDIIARQKVDLYSGDQLSYVFDRLMKANGFGYGHSGSLSQGFYLANIRKKGIAEGAKIPDKLKKYLDDAGWTQKDYHDNQLGDDDFTQHSGWMVKINGDTPSQGMSAITLDDGDEITFEYTLWNGSDINGTWNWEK